MSVGIIGNSGGIAGILGGIIESNVGIIDPNGGIILDGSVISLFTSRNQFPNAVYGHATNRSATYRKLVSVFRKVTDVQAVFVNSYVPATQETALPDALTVGFRLVHNGVKIPFTFGGAATGTLASGAILRSDIMPIELDPATATTMFQDTFVQAPATPTNNTLLWPVNYNLYNELADGRTFGSNLTGAEAGNPTTIGIGLDEKGFSPVFLIANQQSGTPFVIILGDSIATGQGDISGKNQNTVFSRDEYGFFKRALEDASIPYLSLSKPGDRSSAWNTSGFRTLSKELITLSNAKIVIDEYDVNDISAGTSFATLKSLAIARWEDLRTRGIRKIFVTTKTPKTTSTDYFRTTGSQTPAAGFTVGGVRELRNEWDRAGNDGLTQGYFDVADAVESARNSALWAASIAETTGIVTSSTSTTLTVAAAGWTAAQWQDYQVQITGGTGFPQSSSNLPRTIRSNTTDTLTVIAGQAFSPALAAASTFRFFRPMTLDGTHPTSHGHKLMAVAVQVSQLS